MLTYTYRYYNGKSEAEYGRWLAGQDWNELFGTEGSNEKTEIYQREVTGAQDRIFPQVSVKRKLSDPPGTTGR